MKHGPIALLDESTPVVSVATDSPVLEKVASNMQEVRARGARVIALASDGNVAHREYADDVITLPDDRLDAAADPGGACRCSCSPTRSPRRRGLNVDQPRNLAKTVTVE